jgi:hypothetical protein
MPPKYEEKTRRRSRRSRERKGLASEAGTHSNPRVAMQLGLRLPQRGVRIAEAASGVQIARSRPYEQCRETVSGGSGKRTL